jgi:hypothetical protein
MGTKRVEVKKTRKLTPEQVREIRGLAPLLNSHSSPKKKFSHKGVGRYYGVNAKQIRFIIQGLTYKDVL